MTNVLSSHTPFKGKLHNIHEGHQGMDTKVTNERTALCVMARDFEAGRENGGEM
jgi:hypothetical protein